MARPPAEVIPRSHRGVRTRRAILAKAKQVENEKAKHLEATGNKYSKACVSCQLYEGYLAALAWVLEN